MVVSLVTSVSFYLSLVALALLYLASYMFGELGTGTGHDILAVVVMGVMVTFPTVLWKKKTRTKND
jgi:NhaP-type Na+/H+ or K+/H+ antiporter